MARGRLSARDLPKGLKERVLRDGRERTWLGLPLRACFVAAALILIAVVFDLPASPWLVFGAALVVLAIGVALSYLVWAPAIDPVAIDERLDARDAVATLLQLDQLALASGPAVELLRRDLGLRFGLRPRARRERRVRRRWVLLALLLLLLIFVLPGHRDYVGTGPAAPTAGAPEAGAGGKASPEPSGGAGAKQPRQDSKKPGKRTSQGGSQPKPSGGGKPPPMPAADRVETLVVFPSFKDSGRRTERLAPKIDRAPRAPAAKAQPQAEAGGKQPPEAIKLRLEWQRQRERALNRGVLLEWEARWLELYAKSLDRLVDDGQGSAKKAAAKKGPAPQADDGQRAAKDGAKKSKAPDERGR